MKDPYENLVQSGSRSCNHKDCGKETSSLRRAYCSVWHEFLDLVSGKLLYEGTRYE